MLETDRTTTLDPQARLAVLLATTGLTQLDLAKLLGVASRTVRRWMQGVCTPAVAIKEGSAARMVRRVSHRKIAGENRRVLSHDEVRL
jgi:transcriptional regulator with XRE-family HTH domain